MIDYFSTKERSYIVLEYIEGKSVEHIFTGNSDTHATGAGIKYCFLTGMLN